MRDRDEFQGYWSDRDKKIWEETDWRARDYKELPVEDDAFLGSGYFYSSHGVKERTMEFVKYIRPNNIFPPYYGPIYTSELLEYMKEGGYLSAMYDGNHEGNYDIHDRFETQELYDRLSH